MKLRMVIAGGRDFDDYERVDRTAQAMISAIEKGRREKLESIEIISGGARGADKMGEVFATNHGYLLKVIPADWDTYGKFAGYQRNERMAKYAACVETPELRNDVHAVLVACWDGRSRGTKNMISFAHMYEFNDIVIEHYPAKKEVSHE